jgi:mycofactocin system glycosyltransferase
MTNAQGDLHRAGPRFAPGFRVTLDPSVELCPDGRHLLAGSPTRIVPLGADEAPQIRSMHSTGSTEVTAANRQMIDRLLALDVLQPLPSEGVSRLESVTAVIPVRDQPDQVEALLRSEDAFGGVTDVIVVDDGSDDPLALLKLASNATSPKVDVVRSDVSLGPAGARNLGASLAITEFVVFVDADCRPTADWLHPLLAHFDDDAVAMVAPRIRAVRADANGEAPPNGVRGAVLEQLLSYELERGPLDLGDGPSAVGPDRPRNHVPSAAVAVRRSAFDAVSGFDPSLRFGEDTDLVWRLADGGWVVRYEPSSEVQHEIRTSVGAIVRQRFEYGTGAVEVAERFPGRFTLLSIEPANLTALALAGAGLSLPAACVAVASTALPALQWNDLGVPLERTGRRRTRDQLGEAARLAWLVRQGLWPVTLVLSLFSRRFRRLALVALLAPPVLDWKRRRGRLSLLGWITFSVIDALASGAGVWTGCLRRRSFRVLLPRWSPGRGHAEEPSQPGPP